MIKTEKITKWTVIGLVFYAFIIYIMLGGWKKGHEEYALVGTLMFVSLPIASVITNLTGFEKNELPCVTYFILLTSVLLCSGMHNRDYVIGYLIAGVPCALCIIITYIRKYKRKHEKPPTRRKFRFEK